MRRGRCPHRPGDTNRFYGNPRRIRWYPWGDVGIAPYGHSGSARNLCKGGQSRPPLPGFAIRARVYLKTPNAPGQRAFLRCAASFFLEIRQYSCKKMSCATQKSLAAGHIMSFQIHPKTYVIDRFSFCSNRIEMEKGGCSKEQPPFLTNETEKVNLFTFR